MFGRSVGQNQLKMLHFKSCESSRFTSIARFFRGFSVDVLIEFVGKFIDTYVENMENYKPRANDIPEAYRPFLKILTVYKSISRTNDRALWLRNFGQALGVTLLLSLFVCLYLAYELSVCIQENFNLNMISQPLSFFIGSSQVFIVYCLLTFGSTNLFKTIETINEIVKKSKLYTIHLLNSGSFFFVTFSEHGKLDFIHIIDIQEVKCRHKQKLTMTKTRDNTLQSQGQWLKQ